MFLFFGHFISLTMMAFYNNLHSEAEEKRARSLIKKAINLADAGELRSAIPMFIDVLNIYIDIGEYMHLAEVFDTLLPYVETETDLITVIEYLKEVIVTVEYLDIPEEESYLKQALATLAYKNEDYANAAVFFQNVSEIYQRIDIEDSEILAGTNYLRAAECYEKIGKNKKAEKLVLKAIRIFDISNFDYKSHFESLVSSIKSKKYEESIEIIEKFCEFLNRLHDQVDRIIDEEKEGMQSLKVNVKARLKHMESEYHLIKIICFRRLGEEDLVEETAIETIHILIKIIDDMKHEFENNFYSTADLHRLTIVVFILQFFQEFSKQYLEDPIYMLTSGLNKELREILTKMRFYKFTMELLEYNLDIIKDFIDDLPVSQILQPFKDFIFDSI